MPRSRTLLFAGAVAVLAITLPLLLIRVSYGGELTLRVLDTTGQPLPCRVLIQPEQGECLVPDGAIIVPTPPTRWFVCDGQTRLNVPEGKILVRVERGLEFVRCRTELEMDSFDRSKTIILRRWIDMRDRGYLCGENHIHIDPAKLGPMLVAEGLDFGTALTWWNGPDERCPLPRDCGPICQLAFAGRSVPSSVFDAELEYGWGAAYIQNLPEPMPIETNRRRPNLDYVRHAQESGGLVSYQAGWSREVLLDALLGHVQVVNVCNNNFHLHRFQPRSRYGNLLQVPGFPDYSDTDTGMLRMNLEAYYRLLNCGIRLAAGAGTACGVKPNPVGYNRTYVQVPTDATLTDFNEAWAAGKNFVTNGPMIFVSANSFHLPGDTMHLPRGVNPVKVNVRVESDQPLSLIEIVRDGEVVKEFSGKGERRFVGSVDLEIAQGSWIAARCTVSDDLLSDEELAIYQRGDDTAPMRERPSRLRFAHTSPIYVEVDGRGPAIAGSIQEGLLMLNHFEEFLKRQADTVYIAPTVQRIQQARVTLQERL